MPLNCPASTIFIVSPAYISDNPFNENRGSYIFVVLVHDAFCKDEFYVPVFNDTVKLDILFNSDVDIMVKGTV